MSRQRADDGFTLIEALVALTILALAAGTGFKVLSDGARRLERSKAAQSAVVLGDSILARVGPDFAVRPSHWAGVADDQSWVLDIGNGLADPPAAAGLAAFPVRVAVRWADDRGRRELVLETVRLGPESETP